MGKVASLRVESPFPLFVTWSFYHCPSICPYMSEFWSTGKCWKVNCRSQWGFEFILQLLLKCFWKKNCSANHGDSRSVLFVNNCSFLLQKFHSTREKLLVLSFARLCLSVSTCVLLAAAKTYSCPCNSLSYMLIDRVSPVYVPNFCDYGGQRCTMGHKSRGIISSHTIGDIPAMTNGFYGGTTVIFTQILWGHGWKGSYLLQLFHNFDCYNCSF